jgi:hypothetical protein
MQAARASPDANAIATTASGTASLRMRLGLMD